MRWEEETRDQTEVKKREEPAVGTSAGKGGGSREQSPPSGNGAHPEALRLPRYVEREHSQLQLLVLLNLEGQKREDPWGNKDRFVSVRLIDLIARNLIILKVWDSYVYLNKAEIRWLLLFLKLISLQNLHTIKRQSSSQKAELFKSLCTGTRASEAVCF